MSDPDTETPESTGTESPDTESRHALHELIETLREVDERWVSPEWNLHSADGIAGAHRALMHYLQWGLVGLFERNPAAPRFHRIVAPDRKLLGDNPDAVYFDAPVSTGHTCRVTGETQGAAYVSITVESGAAWGSMDNQVVGVLNDASFDIDADGRFTAVIAHTDPGTPNRLDTEGRPFGIVYWRFMLPEGDIETPRAELVPLAELPSRLQ